MKCDGKTAANTSRRGHKESPPIRKHGEIEWVPLKDSLGRFIAEDILADHDVPAFDRSPYDGFALRAEDTKEASSEHPVEFEVIDHIGAGMVSAKPSVPFRPFVL